MIRKLLVKPVFWVLLIMVVFLGVAFLAPRAKLTITTKECVLKEKHYVPEGFRTGEHFVLIFKSIDQTTIRVDDYYNYASVDVGDSALITFQNVYDNGWGVKNRLLKQAIVGIKFK